MNGFTHTYYEYDIPERKKTRLQLTVKNKFNPFRDRRFAVTISDSLTTATRLQDSEVVLKRMLTGKSWRNVSSYTCWNIQPHNIVLPVSEGFEGCDRYDNFNTAKCSCIIKYYQ